MKKTAAVIFGGQSSEHVVSCMSAVNVISQIDREKYNLLLIGITEEGRWLYVDNEEAVADGSWKESGVCAHLSPDAVEKCVYIVKEDSIEKVPVDLAFPVLHGKWGEDGTIQGLFEMAQIPYVGCGVLASAVSMDKFYTKLIADSVGVRQAAWEPVLGPELKDMDAVVERIEKRFAYPVFIKPSNAGSSRGVSKAADRQSLIDGLREAALHDTKILVEETIVGHEIECAVFGGGSEEVKASGVGEILAAADFYDFEAKYYNAESKTVVNPELPGDAAEEVRRAAVKIFQAVDGYGLARVDFFVKDDGTVVFNEINTLPGFTAISMYPMLWEAAGISKRELTGMLMEHGLKRYGD